MTDADPGSAAAAFDPRVPVDEQGFLSESVKCRRCTYNLRGLKADGLCPECGIAVGLSTQGDFLRFADPEWLSKVHRGTRLILWGVLAAIVANCAGQGISRSTGSSLLGEFIAFVAGLISVWGTWLLTEPDPSGVGEDKWAGKRRFVRFSVLAGLVGTIIGLLTQAVALPAIAEMLIGLLGFGLVILGTLGFIAQMLYLGSLAQRIPNKSLAGRCRFLAWSVGLSGALAAIAGTVVAFGMIGTPPGTMPSGWVMVGITFAGIAAVIYGILSLVSLFTINRFRKELASTIELAQGTYGNAPEAAGK